MGTFQVPLFPNTFPSTSAAIHQIGQLRPPSPAVTHRVSIEVPRDFPRRFEEAVGHSEMVLLFLDYPSSWSSNPFLKSPYHQPSMPELENRGWAITHRLQEPLQQGCCALVLKSVGSPGVHFKPETAIWLNACGFFNQAAGWYHSAGKPHGVPFLCCEVESGRCCKSYKSDHYNYARSETVRPNGAAVFRGMRVVGEDNAAAQDAALICGSLEKLLSEDLGMPSASEKLVKLPHHGGIDNDFIVHDLSPFKAVDISILARMQGACHDWLLSFAEDPSTRTKARNESAPTAYDPDFGVVIGGISQHPSFPLETTSPGTRQGRFSVPTSSRTWPMEVCFSPNGASVGSLSCSVVGRCAQTSRAANTIAEATLERLHYHQSPMSRSLTDVSGDVGAELLFGRPDGFIPDHDEDYPRCSTPEVLLEYPGQRVHELSIEVTGKDKPTNGNSAATESMRTWKENKRDYHKRRKAERKAERLELQLNASPTPCSTKRSDSETGVTEPSFTIAQ